MRTIRKRTWAVQTTKGSEVTFEAMARNFIDDQYSKGNAPSTIKHYEQSLRKICTFLAYYTLGEQAYLDLTREEAQTMGGQTLCSVLDEQGLDKAYRAFLYNLENVNDQTINTYFRDYRVIVYYAIDHNLAESRQISIKNLESGIKDVYTIQELEKLLKRPGKKCSFSEYRNWVVVNYLLATGNRVSTVVNLKISDLDFDDNMIAINVQKNKKRARIPMEKAHLAKILRTYIDEWLIGSDGTYLSEYLFPSSYAENSRPMSRVSMGRAIANYNRSRGVQKTSIHLFRHTFVKNWIIGGGDLHSLQRILGHSTLDMVVHYANLYDTDLREKVDEYSALSHVSCLVPSHAHRKRI